MHAHTLETSPCGRVNAKEMVYSYKKAGYDGIVITDHFNDYVLEAFEGDKKSRVDHYLMGYEKALSAGKSLGITVFFGIETNLKGGAEDYLIYGPEPDFLYEYPLLYLMTPEEVSKLSKERGYLFVQAHPFRSYCRPQTAEILSGIEVFNGNPRHGSNNHLAEKFAMQHPELILTSGSDFHQPEDLGRGGMIFNEIVKDNRMLVEALKDRAYQLIKC